MEVISNKPVGRILISNDDGIDSIGITILCEIATALCDDIWIIAPSENRSGASRSITLRRDVVIEEIAPKTFRCSGTPSDCIIFGMAEILDHAPDLVLTGINHGMNVADDILYSGTVAGAMEASFLACQRLHYRNVMAAKTRLIMPQAAFMVNRLSAIFWIWGSRRAPL